MGWSRAGDSAENRLVLTMFRAQALKDLHSGVRMFFQPGDYQIFIGIEFACALGSLAARLVAGF
jgi:hypothetical protein